MFMLQNKRLGGKFLIPALTLILLLLLLPLSPKVKSQLFQKIIVHQWFSNANANPNPNPLC